MESKGIPGIVRRMSRTRRVSLLMTCVAFVLLAWALGAIKSGRMLGKYEMLILNMSAIFAIAALSMNLVNGFTGLFSLGQAGFMSVGAYTCALLTMSPQTKAMIFNLKPIEPWLAHVQIPFVFALIAGGLVAAVAAAVIGFPVLRLKGDYLAIATLGFSEIIRVVFTNLQTITNGSTGLKNIPQTANLWWTMGVLALIAAFILRLMRTSYGRALKAIRDDEVAAESMGVALFKHKMLSFTLSAFIAGLGGGLLASIVGAVNPLQFRFVLAYELLLIVVLGGMGSVSGSIVAAFVITTAKEWLRWLDEGFSLGIVAVPPIAGMRMVVFSALLMFVILFYRRGLFGQKEFSWAGTGRIFARAGRFLARLFSPGKGGESA